MTGHYCQSDSDKTHPVLPQTSQAVPLYTKANVGDTIVLPCSGEDIGENILVWRHDLAIVTAGHIMMTRNTRYSLVHGFDLQITAVEMQDAGDYVCQTNALEKKIHKLEIFDKLQPVDNHTISTTQDNDHDQLNNKQTSLRPKRGNDHHDHRHQRDALKKHNDHKQLVKGTYTDNDEYRLRYTKTDPTDNSEYVMKYIQTQTIPLYKNGNHNKSRIHSTPEHDKSRLYLTKKNSIGDEVNAINREESLKNQRRNLRRRNHNNRGNGNGKQGHHQQQMQQQQQRLINDNNNGKLCVKCPPERTVVAQKYLDGALIELPNLSTCRNQQISKNLYELETLFGRKMNYVLPEGDHSFIARILNKKTKQYEQNCVIKYKVIVRQCGRYIPHSRQLRVKCDLGGVWGSKCYFTCKNLAVPSHLNPVECGDDTQWVGDEPTCNLNNDSDFSSDYSLYKRDNLLNTNSLDYGSNHKPAAPATSRPSINQITSDTKPSSPKKIVDSCEFPLPPEHGTFSCEIQNEFKLDTNGNGIRVANGSMCRIQCDTGYDIPAHLYRHSIYYCVEGSWNATVANVCRLV